MLSPTHHSSPASRLSGTGTWARFNTALLITLSLSDFFGANALRVQTAVSGTYVYEYCTSDDECLALLKDPQQVTCTCLLSFISMIRLLKKCKYILRGEKKRFICFV